MNDDASMPDALDALRPEWSDLWRRDDRATPFQSPEWLIAWWRTLGGGELHLIEARGGGRLVGLAPMFVHEEAGRRRLMPVGVSHSDYLDALIDPNFAEAATERLFEGFARCRDRWDICEWPDLRPRSWLLAPTPAGWRDDIEPGETCPVLTMADSDQPLASLVPRKMARDLAQARKRAAGLGSVRIERAEAATLKPMLDSLVELHGARWAGRGEPGVLADEKVRQFHAQAAPALMRIGVLRVYFVYVNDRIVGVYYGFCDGRRAYAYLNGVDTGDERQSFGTLLVAHAIEEAMREGATEFHFLRGGEGYKYAWGAEDRPNVTRRLTLSSAER